MEDVKTTSDAEKDETVKNPFNVERGRFLFPKKLHCGHWVEDVKALGWFGKDIEGKYTTDPKVLEYLHIPKNPCVEFDLTLKHKDDEFRNCGLSYSGIFRWIMDHHTDINGKAKKIDADFVTTRFDLHQLMCTPYERRKGWQWTVMKVKGVIYTFLAALEKVVIDEKANGENSIDTNSDELLKAGTSSEINPEEKCKKYEESSNIKSEAIGVGDTARSDEQKEPNSGENVDVDLLYAVNIMGRWGCKFEHYLLSPSPDLPPNPNRPIRRFDSFAVAFSAKLGRHKLLYAGEMDGMPDAQAPKDLDNAEFVELKTVNENVRDYNFRRHKLLQYWAQNVWVKVKYLLLGYRDDNVGVVKKLEKFHSKHLPRLANDLWDPYKCFEYVRLMLNIASSILRKEKEGTQLKFFWLPDFFEPKSLDIALTIIPPYEGEGEAPKEFPMAKFIPDSYYKWLNENFDDEGNLLQQTN